MDSADGGHDATVMSDVFSFLTQGRQSFTLPDLRCCADAIRVEFPQHFGTKFDPQYHQYHDVWDAKNRSDFGVVFSIWSGGL